MSKSSGYGWAVPNSRLFEAAMAVLVGGVIAVACVRILAAG